MENAENMCRIKSHNNILKDKTCNNFSEKKKTQTTSSHRVLMHRANRPYLGH